MKQKVSSQPKSAAGKTLLPDFCAPHIWITEQKHDVLLSVKTKSTQNTACSSSLCGWGGWTDSLRTAWLLSTEREDYSKAVPQRVPFITKRTGNTNNMKKPRSCQPATPNNAVSKEFTQSLCNWAPQAQLAAAATSSSLFSTKSTPACLLLRLRTRQIHTQSITKTSEDEQDVPCLTEIKTPAAYKAETFPCNTTQQLKSTGQGQTWELNTQAHPSWAPTMARILSRQSIEILLRF